MLTIGLTGGAGSGKTTVARLFEQLGVLVIYTDQIAREVVKPGSNALKKIAQHFGKTIITDSGELDRSQLRGLIFAKEEERLWLEDLLHPLIHAVCLQKIKEFKGLYCMVEIPLLFESKIAFPVDRILLVDAPKPLQKKRLKQRDGRSEAEIEAMLRAQVSRPYRLSHAHEIITNDGDLNVLQHKVLVLHEHYLTLA